MLSVDSSFRRLPSRSSPTAPVSQAVVDCGSPLTASMEPPSFGCFLRMRASRFARRRSNSRRAEAPGVPTSIGAGSDAGGSPWEQARHRTVFVRPLVDRLDPGGQLSAAETAGAGVPELHLLLVGRLGHGWTVDLGADLCGDSGPRYTDLRASRANGPAYKPGSVLPVATGRGDHPSRTAVAGDLQRSTRMLGRATLPVTSTVASCLTLLQVGFT